MKQEKPQIKEAKSWKVLVCSHYKLPPVPQYLCRWLPWLLVNIVHVPWISPWEGDSRRGSKWQLMFGKCGLPGEKLTCWAFQLFIQIWIMALDTLSSSKGLWNSPSHAQQNHLHMSWSWLGHVSPQKSINLFLLFLPLLLNLAGMGSSFFKSRAMCKLTYKLGMNSLVTKIAFCVSRSENLIAFWKIFCCSKFSSLAWLISMLLPSILSSLIAGSSQLCNSVRHLQTQARRSCLSPQFWGFLGTALSARAERGKLKFQLFVFRVSWGAIETLFYQRKQFAGRKQEPILGRFPCSPCISSAEGSHVLVCWRQSPWQRGQLGSPLG